MQELQIRKAALTLLASKIPEKNFPDLKEALAMHDKDNTGKVTVD